MVETHRESNVNGGGSCFESLEGSFNVEMAKANGVAVDAEAGPSGSGCGSLLTYKRRRSRPSEKKGADYTNDGLPKHKRNIILDQIYQSLDSGGLKKCIQSAILFPTGSGSGTAIKESFHSFEDWSKSTSQTGTLLDGFQNATKSSVDLTSNGSVTELCSCTFFVITSEHFAKLCKINFVER